MLELQENIREVKSQYDKNKNNCNKIEQLDYMRSLIKLYHNFECKKTYEEMMREYKVRYIYNESKVEGNITPEEQSGNYERKWGHFLKKIILMFSQLHF